MMSAAELVDGAMEGLVVPSFTGSGTKLDAGMFGWRDLGSYRLDGRVIAITGATSGLGRAAAEQLRVTARR